MCVSPFLCPCSAGSPTDTPGSGLAAQVVPSNTHDQWGDVPRGLACSMTGFGGHLAHRVWPGRRVRSMASRSRKYWWVTKTKTKRRNLGKRQAKIDLLNTPHGLVNKSLGFSYLWERISRAMTQSSPRMTDRRDPRADRFDP